MTEKQLRVRLWQHNLLSGALAGVAAIGSISMWPITFWIIRNMFCGGRGTVLLLREDVSWNLAWLGIALIAIVGFGPWRPRTTIDDFPQSEFSEYRGGFPHLGGRSPGASLYIVYHIVFMAPALFWKALELYRQIIRVPDIAIGQAAALHHHLRTDRRWILVSELQQYGAGLFLLDRLGLIWTEMQHGELLVRIPAGDDYEGTPSST